MTAAAGLLPGLAVLATGAVGRAGLRVSRRGAVVGRLPVGRDSGVLLTESGDACHGRRRRLATVPPRIEAALVDAALPVEPAVAWTGWLAAVAGAPVVALIVGGPGLSGVALLAVVVGPALAVRSRRGGAAGRLEAALPGALEAVARSLRSGASLRQAVAEAGAAPTGAGGRVLAAELARAAADAGQGASLVAALEGVAARRPLPGLRLGVAALCLGAETGGAQARAVDGVAATVRERLAVAAELRALASQARISALVIGLAPVGFGGFAAATDPRTARFMLHTPAGLALLSVGLTLDGLGWLWMQRLARVGV
jgi:tight adherence protein B